ncbi:hypothetical protein NQ315_001356 [Exocentrus adspersus]|uniref:Fibronectin type-III domain-containing protein n=1 Tax=Exocentrus adspersus TaxID=1586481 RepID=A0AAV8WFE5_9CUCU|nr:hypothetical protein NQ315_001356 [Exocentrus adspersus]
MVGLKLLLIILCGFLRPAQGQDGCEPNTVQNISIISNTTLTWDVDPSPTCTVTSFRVNVVEVGGEEEYFYELTENSLDVSSLKACVPWSFTVAAIADDVAGVPAILTADLPLPPDADLSIFYWLNFNKSHTILNWDLSDRNVRNCSLQFKLTILDLYLNTTEDFVVESKAAPLVMSPCVPYEMALRAVQPADSSEGPIMRMTLILSARAQLAPTLKTIDITATSINMTWALEGRTNRCSLVRFFVEGGDHFNVTVPLHDLEDTTTVSVELNELSPNSMYYFEVRVENMAGNSTVTPIAVQTLMDSPPT